MATTLTPAVQELRDAEHREAWDRLVAGGATFGLLQSWAWGTFKERLGWRAIRLAIGEGDDLLAGVQLLVKRIGPVAFVYAPRGPVGRWTEPDVTATLFAAIRRVATAHRALLVRLDPPTLEDPIVEALLAREGFQPARVTNQPRATIVVDMADGPEEALGRMHHKARYNIRRAARMGVGVRIGTADDLPAFHRMMRVTGSRAGFTVRDLEYYRTQWETLAAEGTLRLFIATYEGRDVAMNVTAVCGGIGAYLHGASANDRRDLNPNEHLMFEAMRWAASEGCTAFDLWGVPDEVGEAALDGSEPVVPDERAGLWGVYGFKRRMGRRVELYTRSHELARPAVLRPLLRHVGVSGTEKGSGPRPPRAEP